MRSSTLGCALVLSAALSGCYRSHRLSPATTAPDAGRADAATRDGGTDAPTIDAGLRDGDYWTLERRDARLSILHELGCTQHEGGRIALDVTAPLESVCEHEGPVENARASDGTLVVTAFVWVQHRADPAACLGITAISRRTLLLPASEGTFRAVSDDGGSRVEIRVGAIDDLPCSFAGPPDAPCILDCQCQMGLVCIPQLGDFVACDGGHCGDPCNTAGGAVPPVYGRHLECASSEECRTGVAASSDACQPIEGEPCDPDAASCEPGLSCPRTGAPSECDWEVRLSAATRHVCAGDSDCDPGLYCVEHVGGDRSCEVPCFSNEMRCPPMHECRADRWVCEWIGE